MAIKRGSTVTQIVTPVTGVVEGFQVDQETGDRLIKVVWEVDGETRTRFFTEAEVVEVAPPAA
jgi:hypothetical protein